MKKNIITMAIAIAALCGIPAIAQTPQTAQCARQECTKPDCNKTRCDRKDDCRRSDPFAGITLSDQQKTALDALKPAKGDRADKQRTDRRQSRRDYINGVKNILTPDQYVIFLENMVVEMPAPRHHADGFNKKSLRRDGKKMQRVEARHDFGNKDNKKN